MYYQHFGLAGPPFGLRPTPEQPYLSKGHREALAALEWGLLHEPSGLTLLVGEAGTGKTTLVYTVLAQQANSVRVAYVANPKLDFNDILRLVGREFGFEPAAPGRLELMDAAAKFMAHLAPHESAAIIVDEAHELSGQTLGELRLLSNWDRPGQACFQLVLVGQPELIDRLSAPGMRQLNDRIGARALLKPLDRHESYAYAEYRVIAQNGDPSRIFARGVLDRLIAHSDGIPRRINVLCHNAMLLAYATGAKRVTMREARAALAEHENLGTSVRTARNFGRPAFRFAKPLAVFVLLGVIGAGAARLGSRSHGYRWVHNVGAQAALPSALRNASQAPGGPFGVLASAGRTTAAARADQKSQEARHIASRAPCVSVRGMGEEGRLASFVIVRRGDNLAAIAHRCLGSTEAVDLLVRANPRLVNINRIYPDEVLALPTQDYQEASTDKP